MKLGDVVAEVLDGLPDEVADLVRSSIRFEVRPVPTSIDLARGAAPTDQGLFVGYPVRSEEDEEGGELYVEEGDDVACAEGSHELYAEEGDDVAEVPHYRPGGVIVIFGGNIKPLNRANVSAVILHELAHFLGETEEEVDEMGLG